MPSFNRRLAFAAALALSLSSAPLWGGPGDMAIEAGNSVEFESGADILTTIINQGTISATIIPPETAGVKVEGINNDGASDPSNEGYVNVTVSGNGAEGIVVTTNGFKSAGGQIKVISENDSTGIRVENGGFTATDHALLNLSSSENGAAIWSENGGFITDATSTVNLGTVGQFGAIVSQTLDAGGADLRLLAAGAQSGLARVYTVANVDQVLSHFSLADSPAFNYTIEVTADGLYQVTVIRRAFASDADPGLTALEDLLLSYDGQELQPDNDPNSLWAKAKEMYAANHNASAGDWRSAQNRLTRQSRPQATAQALPQVTEAGRRTAGLFGRKLALAQASDGLQPAYGGGDSGGASLWLNPFYLRTKREAPSAEFSEVKADWWGASLGAAISPNDRFTWGLGLHLLKGDFEGDSGYDADSKAWGLDAGFAARLGSDNGHFRPILSAVFSHSSHNLDQTRRVRGQAHRSSPDVDVTGLALALSHDLPLTDSITLRPRLGLDWFHTSLSDYSESGPAGWALDVGGSSVNSVRSELGTALIFSPGQALDLELRAAWLHEFADRSQPLSSRLRALPSVELAVPQNDSSRDSAALGASLSWSLNDSLALSFDYDAVLANRDQAHQFGGTLHYSF